MGDFLIWLVVVGAFVLIAYALLSWWGVTIPPIVMKVAGILLVAIILVFLIGWAWPLLTSGRLPSLR